MRSSASFSLRLYPAEFRRAYGSEAVRLIIDRARHERSCVLRLRLLMDLAVDVGATSLNGWAPRRPLLAQIDGAPRFDVIAGHGPRVEALGAGMLISALLFAGFTLLFDSTAPTPNPALGRGHRSETPVAAVGSHDIRCRRQLPRAPRRAISSLPPSLTT